ncbi:transposase [Streptomyces virginiae]
MEQVACTGPYSPEFREEAVRLALSVDKPLSETARELEVNAETLRTWVRRHQRASEPTAADLTHPTSRPQTVQTQTRITRPHSWRL